MEDNELKADGLWELILDLRSTSSRNAKKRMIKDVFTDYDLMEVYWSFKFVVGNPLEGWDDDLGVGKKTVRKAAQQAFGVKYEEIRDKEKQIGNLSEVFTDLTPNSTLTGDTETTNPTLWEIGEQISDIAKVGAETQKINTIANGFENYEYPQVFSFAILNDISLGISSKTILQMLVDVSDYTRDELDRAYGIRPDIASIAKQVKHGPDLRMEVRPGDRIKPQLASSRSLPQDSHGWVAQYKYDGARVLIHNMEVDGGTVIKAFTRRRNNVTANLPELMEVDWPEHEFVVDAEAVAYDPETGEPLPFQKIMERFQREKNIEEKREDVEIRFRLFDLLYYAGNGDITERKFLERWHGLSLKFPDDMVVSFDEDLDGHFDNALRDGHEGIIAKDETAPYVFDRDRSWRKVKPVKEPVELEIIGVRRGTGRMSDTLGAIEVKTADGVDVGRVGTGFTDSDRAELWELYQNDELLGKIVEVEFEELQEKDGRYGLRFPRYSRLRPEGEADTLERIKGL